MIKLDISKGVFRNESDEAIIGDDILSCLNLKLFIENETISLVGLNNVLRNHLGLEKVYKNINILSEKISNLVSKNEDQSISGKLKISEIYSINPIIENQSYKEEITSYIDINKRYAIFYENTKQESVELKEINLVNIIRTPLMIGDTINQFKNMLNDERIIHKNNAEITLNEFFNTILRVNFL